MKKSLNGIESQKIERKLSSSRLTEMLGVAAAISLFGIACSPADGEISSQRGVVVQSLRGASDLNSSFVGFDFLVTNSSGAAVACDTATTDVSINVSFDDGQNFAPIDAANVELKCGVVGAPQVAMVLDNSGSQKSVLETTKVGATNYVNDILGASGRTSLVRVSTQSTVLSELSDDETALKASVDSMFVNKGWTSLYDGIRRGNETLGSALGDEASLAYADVSSFCNDAPRTAIVAFTNGEDNNSADEKLGDDSDGINTTIDDLKSLKIQSTRTPVYTIGLGERVDSAVLTDLSNATGGRHLQVDSEADLPSAFDLLADYPGATTQICGELSQNGCGEAVVRISYTHTDGNGDTYTDEQERSMYIPCPVESPQGRVASILLTLDNPGIDADDAKTLASNAVAWVSAVAAPKVLVVRDDNHHGESPNDTMNIEAMLRDAGFDVTLLDEPQGGTTVDDLNGYDVVWYSNPGWPMDEQSTFEALRQYSAAGHGLIMQGDDMSWSMGRAFPMNSLTRLSHDKNGTKTCGVKTDNNKGENYRVTIGMDTHPITAGLEGATFLYGDDIDHSTPVGEGESVLASASLDGDANCMVQTPVIVAYDPAE